ncbi:YciN family protein [Pectobacterium cacticida]|uniref:YciN family protein n=1 Tax=Pectobacterium cacticida TaxID=69221 RepID=A0ABZ2G530_9GAMM|nr:YciN family protein [Pectobacterium cacticida]UYX05256.1 YciN family protein [Pectobacterium cacticida]
MSFEYQGNVEKRPIDRQNLLAEANDIIKHHDDYLHGMVADGVEQKNGVLVFRGEFFLDEAGMPTLKSTAVFNMFKHLAHVLSEKYYLVD